MKSSSPRLLLLFPPTRPCSIVIVGALVLLALCGPPSPLGAQVLYGSLVGNVTDETGAAIPGATVTITHRQTGASRDAVTDGTGAYRLEEIAPGDGAVMVIVVPDIVGHAETSWKEGVKNGRL